MSEINILLESLIPKIREYRTVEEIPVIIQVLSDLYHEKMRKEDEERRIGKISITNDLISEYAGERCVYKGYFRQLVAVKQQPSKTGRRERENEIIDMLEKKDKCIRVLYSVEDGQRSYMVMEPCFCNLADLMKFFIKKRTETEDGVTAVDARLKGVLPDFELYDRSRPRRQTLKILRELIDEMTTCHSLGLGHSEFNPELIFLAMEAKPVGDGLDMAPLCVKFYDYDKCVKECKYAKEDNQNASTKLDISHLSNDWTEWWKSPEQLTLDEKASLSSDMFLLGLVFYYVLSEGNHPFDSHPDRIPRNIVVDEPRLWLLVECPEASHLIKTLLQKEPHLRGTIKEVSLHPLFWSRSKKMQFLIRVNDRIKVAEKKTQQSTQLQCLLADLDVYATKTKMFSKIFGSNQKTWHTEIQKKQPNFDIDGNYENLYGSVKGLLRFISNRVSHYWEDPTPDQVRGEPLLDGLYRFFDELFPSLLIELYKIILKHCRTEEFFMEFFYIHEDT